MLLRREAKTVEETEGERVPPGTRAPGRRRKSPEGAPGEEEREEGRKMAGK